MLAVPVSRRLGLGAVLGYLIAGAIIGPAGLGIVFNVNDVLHFAEFGVVLLLFIIGLELQPSRLWTMRKAIFGMGAAQVAATGAVLAAAAMVLDVTPVAAAVIGLTLALSSTAFALQNLAEKGQLTTRHGRAAFAILLFQDVAAIPLIALVPLLGAGIGAAAEPDLLDAVKVIAMLAAVSVGGRYALRYALRIVALTNTRELFTAMALLVVVAVSLVMQSLGLSMALGAFLAGVLLADSEYRHALEADIEPFKGLLLGLFFMSVGMSLNLGMIASEPLTVAALVAGLVGVKLVILYGLGRMNGLDGCSARALAIAISQGGEFAFVIFAVAAGAGLLAQDEADLLKAVVTLSMATTPLLAALDGPLARRGAARSQAAVTYDEPPPDTRPVIIAGFGRFGQIVARILRAKKIPFIALEISPAQVDFVRGFGNEVFYGDASRIDLLRAAKADQAAAFVLAIDDPDASVRTALTVRETFPDLPIYARARNRNHAYRLMDAGIRVVWRETFLSSLDMAGAVLAGLGYRERDVRTAVETFRSHDERRLYAHYGLHNDVKRMQDLAKAANKELEELFEADALEPDGKDREADRLRAS